MPVRIAAVHGDSRHFRPGDEIITIDSRPVEDQLDLLFLIQKEGSARFEIRRSDGSRVSRVVSIDAFDRASVEPEEMTFRGCTSRCAFCFVDQMPPGLRRSLYFKDDDFRLSFLFGNYVTLNDVSEHDLERIIEMHLSPIYVSVHAVETKLRSALFGRAMRRDIMQTLRRLAGGGITMHAQVVLVPGMNDGAALERTIDALHTLYPSVASVSVVPVGLTRHRAGLPALRRISVPQARHLITWAQRKQSAFRESTGESFLHLSDELYLKTRRSFPRSDRYDGFPQLANGVGMCRLFIDETMRKIDVLHRRSVHPAAVTVITGTLGGAFLRRYILPAVRERLPQLSISTVSVRNRLFGDSVTVSGLLAGSDIAAAVERTGAKGCFVLPPNCLNHDGLLIDDMTPSALGERLGARVLVARESFLESRILKACGKGRAS
jgi:putative radical SAM enzyme (TIGR03279 family)